MENMNQELQEDRRKNHYVVETKRDTRLMLTFIEFKNRVEHPAATVYMIAMGVMLIGLMYKQADSIAMVGKVIGYIFGAVLILMGLFRKYISVYLMKSNPQVNVDEEITYLFGNTGIRADKPQEGTEEHLANYKEVYCVWEDEADFYLGMNNDDLIVLQKANFTTGEVSLFKDFILEKSGAKYIWKPAKFVNVCKNAVLKAKIRATQMQMATDQDNKEEK